MFVLGAAFVYFLLLPMALRFFLGFEIGGGEGPIAIQLEARISEYLGLIMRLIFAFGFCFELPVLLILLGRVGIVSSATLRSGRRYAIVGITVLAAVVTPPDILSQISLIVPLILLYEASVIGVRIIERRRNLATEATAIIKP
jgi:sec-independent protein translocase protein TatC